MDSRGRNQNLTGGGGGQGSGKATGRKSEHSGLNAGREDLRGDAWLSRGRGC